MIAEPARVGVAELAEEITMAPGAWTVVIVDRKVLESAQTQLEAELREALLESGEGEQYRVDLCVGPEALDRIAAAGPRDVAVAGGWEELDGHVLERLDARRNAVLGASVVLICTDAAAARFRARAPHLWSWVGGRCLRLAESEGVMNVAERLDSLREAYGFNDAELVRQVEAGMMQLDPAVTEWLILAGRGDLIGR